MYFYTLLFSTLLAMVHCWGCVAAEPTDHDKNGPRIILHSEKSVIDGQYIFFVHPQLRKFPPNTPFAISFRPEIQDQRIKWFEGVTDEKGNWEGVVEGNKKIHGLMNPCSGQVFVYDAEMQNPKIFVQEEFTPFPLLVEKEGVKISAQYSSPLVFVCTIEGMHPREECILYTSSGNENLYNIQTVDKSGQFYVVFCPQIVGSKSGIAQFRVIRQGKPICLDIPWGLKVLPVPVKSA